MIKIEKNMEKEIEEDNCLNYQSKKLLHMIIVQIMDIEGTLHYIQKKHTLHQLKQALSQIYNIFSETEPLFKYIKAGYLYQEIKKIMNCFGIIYVILMAHIQDNKKMKKDEQDDKSEQDKINVQRKQMKTSQRVDPTQKQLRSQINKLGGIFLYNQTHIRHIAQEGGVREQQRMYNNSKKQLTKQQLKQLIQEQLNDNTHLISNPDEILDIFTFKFKYGNVSQVVTFHDQLTSISKYFKQIQNEAFQFLNKTKDQSSLIDYNRSFKDVMEQVKREKQLKARQFSVKIESIFRSIKHKTQGTINQIESKLLEMQKIKTSVQPTKQRDREVQTSFNITDEIQFLKKRILDAQYKYNIMLEIKKKQIESNYTASIQLQNQINLKNRQIVYLQLNRQESKLVISNLNKKIKFLNDKNKNIIDRYGDSKDVELSKKASEVELEEMEKAIERQLEENQQKIQSLKKQKKIAKKLFIDRKSQNIEDKSIFMKRFTQQMQHNPLKNQGFMKLSEIDQGENEENISDQSVISNKNTFFLAREKVRKPISKHHIAQSSIKTISKNSSLKSVNGNEKPKHRKQKYASLLINKDSQDQGLAQIVATPDCESFNNSDQDCNADIDPEELRKIQQLFKKQMRNSKYLSNSKRQSTSNQKSNFAKNTSRHVSVIKHDKSQITTQRQNKSIINKQNQSKELNNQANEPNNQVTAQSSRQQPNKLLGKDSKNYPIETLETNLQEESMKKVQQRIGNVEPLKQGNQRKELKICPNQINFVIDVSIKSICQVLQTNIKRQEQEQPNNQGIKTQKIEKSSFIKSKANVSKKVKSSTIHTAAQGHNTSKSFKNHYIQQNLASCMESQTKFMKSKDLQEYLNSIEIIKEKPQINERNSKNVQEFIAPNLKSHGSANLEQQVHKIKKQQNRLNVLKQFTNQQKIQVEKQEREVKEIAKKSKNIQEFKQKITEIHLKKCGVNCKHLKNYISNFTKYRINLKQRIRMHVQNLTENIREHPQNYQNTELPNLYKKF